MKLTPIMPAVFITALTVGSTAWAQGQESAYATWDRQKRGSSSERHAV